MESKVLVRARKFIKHYSASSNWQKSYMKLKGGAHIIGEGKDRR